MMDERSAPVRRAGYSLHPGARGLRAQVATSGAPVELRRLSLHDGELAFDLGHTPSFRDGALFALQVESDRWGRVTLRARCQSVRLVAGQTVATFEHSMARREAAKLHSILEALHEANQAYSSWERQDPLEEIDAPRQRILGLLRAMVRLHRTVRVTTDDGSLLSPAHLTDEGAWPRVGFTVDVRAPRGDYVFHVGPELAESEREVRLLRATTRTEAWAPAPSRSRLEVDHPLFADERATLELVSLSRGTLRVRARSGVLFHPGLELPGSVLRWKGGELTLGLVVGETLEDAVDGRCCELHVQPGDSRSRRRWCEQVDRLCHPHTRVDASEADDLWELYAESGYLNISDKHPELFEHLRDRFRRSAEAIAEHPDLGAQVTWRSMDGLDGSVTFLTAWERSSLIYQLARGAERPLWMSGNRPLYDLYLRASEHVVREGAEWIVVYVQHAGARFSKKVNRDFPRRYADGETAYVGAFRAWEIPVVRHSLPSARDPRLAVAAPTESELEAWLVDLPKRRPLAYREGYDLVPGRARLSEPEARFGRAGLGRGRTFRMATLASRPVAMAWIEHVEDGVHLFGLLDAIRIDLFEPLDPAEERAVRRALVEEAQAHLATLGKRQLVFFDEAMGEAPVPGAVDLGDADQALYSTALCPELLEEVAIAVEGKAG